MLSVQKGEAYVHTAVKLMISAAVGGLLLLGVSYLIQQPFIRTPLKSLQTGYSYSDNRNTYQHVAVDQTLVSADDKPGSPNITPAVLEQNANPSVPGAPSNPVLSQQGPNIVVQWSAPLRNGGAPIMGYYIYVDGKRVTTDMIQALTYTIYGLSPSDHTIIITAINQKGEGAGATAKFKLNALVPNTPANVVAKVSGTTVTLTWTAPFDGGSPITSYNVYMNGIQNNATEINGTTYEIRNLKAGYYSFCVTAVNAIGVSEMSAAANIELKTVPDSPTKLQASAQNQTIVINWNAPENTGGSSILGYNVYLNNVKQNSVPMLETSYSFANLTGGGYTVYVTAVNQTGESPAASIGPISVESLPGKPENVQSTQSEDQSITVTWNIPSDQGNLICTGYNVYIDGSLANATPVTIQGSTQIGTFVSAKGYHSGTHTIAVSAINDIGEGPQAIGKAVSIVTLPGVPQSISVTLGENASVNAVWTQPEDTGGAQIIGYNFYVDDQRVNADIIKDCSYTYYPTAGEHTFAVAAVSGYGEGFDVVQSLDIPEQIQVAATANDDTMGTVTGGGSWFVSNPITLRATPKDGFVFSRWESDGKSVSTDTSYTFSSDKDCTYTAVFEKQP